MSPDGDKRKGGQRSGSGGRRGSLTGGGQLPRWARDEVVRSTPKARREPAISQLEQGVAAFSEEKFQKAFGALRKAKSLAPRAATVRELLGLSAYQLERWEDALRELRTYRRLTGETTHLPVEMDCLRALGRAGDVDKAWATFLELGGSPHTEDEARVVYASHLLDRGEVAEAWRVIKPGRLVADPPEGTLRRWAVAARVAAAAGDQDSTRKLVEAIRDRAPEIPWLEELERSLR